MTLSHMDQYLRLLSVSYNNDAGHVAGLAGPQFPYLYHG